MPRAIPSFRAEKPLSLFTDQRFTVLENELQASSVGRVVGTWYQTSATDMIMRQNDFGAESWRGLQNI